MRRSLGWRTDIRSWLVVGLFAVFAGATPELAQNGCLNGIVEMQGKTTGNITLCSAVAQQAPELSQRLLDVQKTVGAQQQQLKELTRLIRDMNAISGGLATRQQTELLRNVLTRLGDPQKTAPEQFDRRASTLSGHFEEVSLQMSSVLANQQTAPRAAAALRGDTGNALARLDFETVTDQFDAISQQLKQMDKKLNKISQSQDDLADSVTDIKQQQQQQIATQNADAEHRKHLAGSTADLSGGALEILGAMRLPFDNDTFSETTRNGVMPAIKAYLDAGMSPQSYYGGSDRFVLTLPAFEGTENFPEILAVFKRHNVNLAGVNRKSVNNFFYTDTTETMQDQIFLTLATNAKAEISIQNGRALLAAGGNPAHALLSAQICKSGWHCAEMLEFLSNIGYKSPTSNQQLTGEQLYKLQRFVEALPLLQKDADKGIGEAAGMLGTYYLRGILRTMVDDRKAFGLFQKGSDAGDPGSMALLGEYYFTGLRWLPRDPLQAVSLFKAAAAKGDAHAMTDLGFVYFAGTGVQDSDDQAASWFRKAAKIGDPNGMVQLHDAIMKSNQTSFLYQVYQVADLARRAATTGDPQLYSQLVLIFGKGTEGIRQNPARANYYAAAAQKLKR